MSVCFEHISWHFLFLVMGMDVPAYAASAWVPNLRPRDFDNTSHLYQVLPELALEAGTRLS